MCCQLHTGRFIPRLVLGTQVNRRHGGYSGYLIHFVQRIFDSFRTADIWFISYSGYLIHFVQRILDSFRTADTWFISYNGYLIHFVQRILDSFRTADTWFISYNGYLIHFVQRILDSFRTADTWLISYSGYLTHFVVCLKRGPQLLPKQLLHTVQSLSFQYPLFALRPSTCSRLCLLPRLPVTSSFFLSFHNVFQTAVLTQ